MKNAAKILSTSTETLARSNYSFEFNGKEFYYSIIMNEDAEVIDETFYDANGVEIEGTPEMFNAITAAIDEHDCNS